MKEIQIKRNDLLKALKENRINHREIFEKSLVGYKKEAIKRLGNLLEELRRGVPVYIYWELPLPKDHTEDYDRVIRMMEMEIREVIEISESEFAQYVMDDWGWKKQWTETTNNYLAQ